MRARMSYRRDVPAPSRRLGPGAAVGRPLTLLTWVRYQAPMKLSLLLMCSLIACTPKPKADDSSTRSPEPATPSAGDPNEHAHAGPSWTLDSTAKGAVLLGDLGTHARAITTTSSEAQAFFNQGLRNVSTSLKPVGSEFSG